MRLDWLWIGDTHFPYCHTDALDFLSHIKKVLKPKNIGHVGDECDGHGWSYHEPDPSLRGVSREFNDAKAMIKHLAKIFPSVTVLESNHGSLFFRKQRTIQLPIEVFKHYNEIWEVPYSWQWHFDYTFKLKDNLYCYAHHGKSNNVVGLSQSMGMCALQGHYHEKMGVAYWANPNNLFWGAQTGCLIDDKSMAFSYNNANLKRPLLGSLGIVNGHAVSIPMILGKNGRWLKRLVLKNL